MKLLGWILGFLVLTVAFITVAGYLSPQQIEVSQTIEIVAPPEAIFPYLTDLEKWQEWEPWSAFDKSRTVHYGDTRRGPGASFSWTGSKTGDGRMEILTVEPPLKMTYREVHGGDEAGATGGELVLLRVNPAVTRVTWTWRADLGENPISRAMGPLVRGAIEPSLAKGLENLERVAKSQLAVGDPAATAGAGE